MISLIKLESFRKRLGGVNLNDRKCTMTEAHKVSAVRSNLFNMYEELAGILDGGVEQLEPLILDTMQKSIYVVLGEQDAPAKKKTKR